MQQSGAATCSEGFVKCFPSVPQAVGPCHRENQVLEAASQALASFGDKAKAAAVSALWNYFVSELCQSASQNLSKKDGAVKTATFFSERFCEVDWRKF